MTIEIPILRLGLAGFNAAQQLAAGAVVDSAVLPSAVWRVAPLAEADAWWVNGERTSPLPDGTLQIQGATPEGGAIQLNLRDIDRPLAFALPLPPPPFEAACSFDLTRADDGYAALERFTAWLAPQLAEFGLASSIIDHHVVLGSGTFQVLQGQTLLAVVNMRGAVGVLPTATPGDFEEAMWRRCTETEAIVPERFAKLSLSQLMWQFAVRTSRDLLPPHYRTGLLYFRRPPRVLQRLLRDTHILLLRELASGCATFDELQLLTSMAPAALSRDLAALYLVGSITSNPKRAAAGATRRLDVSDSLLSTPNSLPADSTNDSRGHNAAPDLTLPARLGRGA